MLRNSRWLYETARWTFLALLIGSMMLRACAEGDRLGKESAAKFLRECLETP